MIVVKLMGGLGNQMFQYAAGYALSKDKNTFLNIDKSWFDNQDGIARTATYELDLLNVSADSADLIDYNIVKNKPLLKKFSPNTLIGFDEKSLAFDQSIYKKGNSMYLNGYWQSEKYFKRHRDDILNEFKITKPLSKKAAEWLVKIEKSNSVSLHIRRGDYASNPHTKSVHGLVPLEYYIKATDALIDSVEDPTFFVFSDDPEWCMRNLKLRGHCEFVINTDGLEDMYLMSKCKHNIIANSSFSWWGAWLNQNSSKIVIAPKKWFNDTTLISKDIVPSSWQKI